MITPGRLPLAGFRNAPFVYAIEMPGMDLRGAEIRAQVRPYPDAPGDPYATFFVANDFAEIDGLPLTNLTLSLPEIEMRALPKGAEIGDPWAGAWDLVVTPSGRAKSVYLLGSFTVLPGVTTYA